MSSTLESASPGDPVAPPARKAAARPLGRRFLADRLAPRFVTLSGVVIIAATVRFALNVDVPAD